MIPRTLPLLLAAAHAAQLRPAAPTAAPRRPLGVGPLEKVAASGRDTVTSVGVSLFPCALGYRG